MKKIWNGNDEMKITMKTTKILKYVVTNFSNKYLKYHTIIKNETWIVILDISINVYFFIINIIFDTFINVYYFIVIIIFEIYVNIEKLENTYF